MGGRRGVVIAWNRMEKRTDRSGGAAERKAKKQGTRREYANHQKQKVRFQDLFTAYPNPIP